MAPGSLAAPTVSALVPENVPGVVLCPAPYSHPKCVLPPCPAARLSLCWAICPQLGNIPPLMFAPPPLCHGPIAGVGGSWLPKDQEPSEHMGWFHPSWGGWRSLNPSPCLAEVWGGGGPCCAWGRGGAALSHGAWVGGRSCCSLWVGALGLQSLSPGGGAESGPHRPAGCPGMGGGPPAGCSRMGGCFPPPTFPWCVLKSHCSLLQGREVAPAVLVRAAPDTGRGKWGSSTHTHPPPPSALPGLRGRRTPLSVFPSVHQSPRRWLMAPVRDK